MKCIFCKSKNVTSEKTPKRKHTGFHCEDCDSIWTDWEQKEIKRLKQFEPKSDEILIAVKRPEGYEDVHPESMVDDAHISAFFEWRIVGNAK